MTNFVPLSRAGHFRLLTDFNKPSNQPITVCYFLEFSSFITFNEKGELEKSYTVWMSTIQVLCMPFYSLDVIIQ